ncbi:MAG: hypothetical protein SFV15_01985 [Polyangiaceae bacterium]|nr:hypothetical protein [Polyangiaceae bacterium]
MLKPSAATFLSLAAVLGTTSTAWAEGSAAEAEQVEIPDAPDTLSQSLQLFASASWVDVWGELSEGKAVRRSLGSGPSIGGEALYGLSRDVALGLWGHWDEYSAPSSCSGCSGHSVAFGPSVTYRLTQGTRLDPWASFGMGYSFTSVKVTGTELSFSGPEWARLGLGADWYLGSSILLGPFAELTVGQNQTVPSDGSEGAAHFRLLGGLRVGLTTTSRK